MSLGSDWAKIQVALAQQGFQVTRTGSGHFKAKAPDPTKPLVTFSQGGNARSIKNTLADLRRIGFMWPPPERSGAALSRELAVCPGCKRLTWDVKLGDCTMDDCATSFAAGPSPRPALPQPSGGSGELPSAKPNDAGRPVPASTGPHAAPRGEPEPAGSSAPPLLDVAFAEVKRLRAEVLDAKKDVDEYQRELELVQQALAQCHETHMRATAAYQKAKRELDRLLGEDEGPPPPDVGSRAL